MNVFAADLWEVFRGGAPDEYRDPDSFFQKAYLTDGLKHLLAVDERSKRSGNSRKDTGYELRIYFVKGTWLDSPISLLKLKRR